MPGANAVAAPAIHPPPSRTRLEIKPSPLVPARFTGGRALVVLNLGSRRALRDDQRRNQRQWPTWPEAVRSSICVGSVLGRKALGNTSRTRKTGLDQAMISEDASFIVAPAQRAHDTHIDHQFKIQALSNGRQPGGDLLGNPVSVIRCQFVFSRGVIRGVIRCRGNPVSAG